MTLDSLALTYGTDKSSAHHDYCPHYERHLGTRRTQPLTLLEVGVLAGASLQMWADYLTHPASRIIGVDLKPQPESLRLDPRVTWVTLDSMTEDMAHLRERLAIPAYDVIIDDASHMTAEQQHLWAMLWPQVAPGGLYVIEDTCCAYWPEFTEAGKWNLLRWLTWRIDDIHCRGKRAHGTARKHALIAANNRLSEHEQTLAGLHVYNGLVMFERRR